MLKQISDTILKQIIFSSTGSLDRCCRLSEEYNTVTATVKVGHAASGSFIDVQPDLPLKDINPLGIYVIFEVNRPSEQNNVNENHSPASDAFSILMKNVKKNDFLPDLLNETDNLKKLKKKFREFLVINKVGWSQDGASKYGLLLINSVGDCLWYLDGHHETLKRQGCGIPIELIHLQDYNKPEKHSYKRKHGITLSKETIHHHVLSLSSALSSTEV